MIFGQAIREPESREKVLRVLFVGLGRYGSEFLKAYAWFCQMPGYRLEMHVIEKDPQVIEQFCARCPELIRGSGVKKAGEARYTINFYGKEKGVDVWSREFERVIKKIGRVSLAHVSLGDDDRNIEASIRLQRLLKRYGVCEVWEKLPEPLIYTVVLNQERLSAAASGDRLMRDHAGTYGIRMMGSLKDNYSYPVIVNSPLQEAAQREHMIWADKSDPEKRRAYQEEFRCREYYQRSSAAKVIRVKERSDMNLPGAREMEAWRNKQIDDRKELSYENVSRWLRSLSAKDREKMNALLELEHMAWNAYIRSEGYVYGEKRDDIARVHPNLVSFGELSVKERLKDV